MQTTGLTEGKSFSLYGQKFDFKFNQNQIEYNKWRLFYDSLATKCTEKYLIEYKKYGNLDDFAEKGFEVGWKVMGEALSETIQVCVKNNIFHIDEDKFLNKYGETCFSDWIDSFFEVNDKYMEIVLKSKDLDEYRTQRRLNRGRFIGGGFGIEGAIKGIATAGLLNMASGAIHGTFNLMGKGLSEIGNASRKSKVYNSEETKETLSKGIYYSVFNIHYALCDILEISLPNPNNVRTADALFNNLNRMQKNDVFKNLSEIILLNPYKVEAYEFLIEAYGDKQEEVKGIAEFFGVNVDIIKRNLLNKVFKNLDFSSEQSTIKSKSIFEECRIEYGLKNSTIPSPYLREINTKLQEFDKKARTVEEKEYSTREDAKRASKELAEVRQLINENLSYGENEAVANQLLANLKSKKFKYGYEMEYIELVEKALEDMDKVERTYNKKVYETKELAKAAKMESLNISKIVTPAKRGSVETINKAIEKIKQSEFSEEGKKRAIQQLETAKVATQFMEDGEKEAEKKKRFYTQRRYIPVRIIRFLIEVPLFLLLIYIFFTTDILGKVVTGALGIWMIIRWYKRKDEFDKVF